MKISNKQIISLIGFEEFHKLKDWAEESYKGEGGWVCAEDKAISVEIDRICKAKCALSPLENHLQIVFEAYINLRWEGANHFMLLYSRPECAEKQTSDKIVANWQADENAWWKMKESEK